MGSRRGEDSIVHTYSPKCLKAMNITLRTILECYTSPERVSSGQACSWEVQWTPQCPAEKRIWRWLGCPCGGFYSTASAHVSLFHR